MTASSDGQPRGGWRALHLFIHHGSEQLEQLVTTTIHPWVQEALSRGALRSWFMVRYWEGGPHLRLRLLGADDAAVAELRDRVETYLKGQPLADPPLRPEEYYATAAGPDADPAGLPWYPDHSVVELPYVPEVDRYGGPAGLAVCEEQFRASSEIAVATIRATPGRRGRLRAVADLLLASVWATGMGWLGAVEWLRGYANSWAYVTEAPPVDVAAVRRAAEAEYLRAEETWLRHRDRVRQALERPGSAAGAWHRQQAETWSRLERLHRAGELSVPPVEIFQSLVHMLHNRVGLRLDEEAYLAWLLSLVLASHTPRQPFFVDGGGALDRQYHEQSKFFHARLDDQRPVQDAPETGRQEFWAPSERVALATPDPAHAAEGLPQVLLRRRSSYGRYTGPVTAEELGTLLYYAAASNGTSTVPGTDLEYRVRTYPSSGARYPVRLLLYCHDVTGLPRGLYLYDPDAHSVGRLVSRDLTADLLRTSPFLDPAESPPIDAAGCPLWIFLVADLTYQRARYGLRAYRFGLIECGHLAQNLSLTAAWLGKSCIGLGGFYDDALNQVVNVDGVNSSVQYLYLVGQAHPLTGRTGAGPEKGE